MRVPVHQVVAFQKYGEVIFTQKRMALQYDLKDKETGHICRSNLNGG